jgi:FtsP/CotA-like multicopper oxidase with cupredoxin domain
VTHDLDINGGASRLSRRSFLRAGAFGLVGTGAAVAFARFGTSAAQAEVTPFSPTTSREVHLVATDGWVSMPYDGVNGISGYFPDSLAPKPFNMYVFGFRDVTGIENDINLSASQKQALVVAQRGAAQISAPVLAFDEGSEIKVTLTNLGLAQRPDLVDGHTMHWHGFNNALPIFDGVPEMSASVPIGKSLIYYYRPHDAGTYMYHCHFEDVEHVQMGMTGLLYVRPLLNYEQDPLDPTKYLQDAQGNPVPRLGSNGRPLRYLYNDEDTRYDREFGLFLSENDPEAHWRDAHIQVSDWSDYKPGFSLFNGRAYPDTLLPDTDPLTDYGAGTDEARLRYQPQGSLFECNSGEKVALRMANLGSLRHTVTVDGIGLQVVGADASQLKATDTTDNSYVTNSIDIAPGESRDVLFTAPDVTSTTTFQIYDRDYMNTSNIGRGGYGGMLTHLVVRPSGVAAQGV